MPEDFELHKSAVLPEGNKFQSEQDIELLSHQVLQSDAFKSLEAGLKSDFQVSESHASLLLHITEELKQLRINLENLKQESVGKPDDSKHHILHALQREIKNLERKVRLLQVG